MTELGKKQATQLGDKTLKWDIKHIISSPLMRAQQTANICARILKLPIDVQDSFKERHYGQWQGLPVSHIPDFERFSEQRYIQPDTFPCRDAESTLQIRSRINTQLRRITTTHTNGNILLISHGDVINCLLTQWTEPAHLDNTEYIRLTKADGKYTWSNNELDDNE